MGLLCGKFRVRKKILLLNGGLDRLPSRASLSKLVKRFLVAPTLLVYKSRGPSTIQCTNFTRLVFTDHSIKAANARGMANEAMPSTGVVSSLIAL